MSPVKNTAVALVDICRYVYYTILYYTILYYGCRDRLLVELRSRDRKVANTTPGRSGREIFFSRVNTVCWLLFGVRSTPVLPQWHVKDPGHSTKSAGGRLHPNTHAPLTQRCRGELTMPLSSRSEETYQETSSHATRLGTIISGRSATVDWSRREEWN